VIPYFLKKQESSEVEHAAELYQMLNVYRITGARSKLLLPVICITEKLPLRNYHRFKDFLEKVKKYYHFFMIY
jgi:hypothetical protein